MKNQTTQAAATKNDLKQAFAQFEKRLDKKFAAIDGKFTAIDGKFTAIDGKFTAIDGKFTAIDGKFTAIDGKFTALEQSIERKLAQQKGDILTTLDRRLGQQKEEILREMDKKFAAHEQAIIKGVAEDIGDMLMPEIEKHDDRLLHLERHTLHPPLTSV